MNSPVPVQTVVPNRARFRDVSSLLTWIYCFLGYMAILTLDQQTCDQLAYAHLIIRKAQRHGGNRLLDYDREFQQQLAANPSRRWNNLEPRLQAATLYGQVAAQPTFCTLCRRTDDTQPCWYRHICLRCQLPHSDRVCPKTLEQRPQGQLTGPQPRQNNL